MDIFQQVFEAIDTWLQDISIQEHHLEEIEEKVKRTILQLKLDGYYNSPDIENLEKVGGIWIALLRSLGKKEEVLSNLLLLYYLDQITLELTIQIILKL